MIIPIKHIANWILIHQCKQAHINYNNKQQIMSILYHKYQVGDKVTISNNIAYSYETPCKGPCKIMKCQKKITATLKIGTITGRLNSHSIKPYKYEETP